MKYRLDERHYDEFVELPAGTEVGDGTEVSWKYPTTCANVMLRGQYKPPSMSMTPLDDEAKKAFAAKFGGEAPERDPTAKIPIHGTDPNAGGTAAPPTGNAFTGKPIIPAPAPVPPAKSSNQSEKA